MPDNRIIRLHARAEVNPKDWALFQQMLTELGQIVQAEGSENVLTHQTYRRSDSFECFIVEAYKDEEAFLNHLERIQPLAEKFKVDWKIKRIELCGTCSQKTIENLRDANVQREFFHYETPLE